MIDDSNRSTPLRVDGNDPLLKVIGMDDGGGLIYAYDGRPFTGVLEDRYADGTLASDFELLNGHPHGTHRRYHPNGRIEEEYFMSYNRVYGSFRRWSEEGELLEERDWGEEYKPPKGGRYS